MKVPADARQRQLRWQAVAFFSLFVIYWLTAPNAHTMAIDSYHFAHILTRPDPVTFPERLYLWLVTMRGALELSRLAGGTSDPFVLVGLLNAAQTALAAVLFDKLLRRGFHVPPPAALVTTAIFAFSYGVWRYATELEVYASAHLMAIVLMLLAVSVTEGSSQSRTRGVLVAAAFGAFVSLAYQPLGIVAGFAIVILIFSGGTVRLAISYLVAYLTILAGAFLALNVLANPGTGLANSDVLDSDGKIPELPEVAELLPALIAFFQNVTSVNWAFAYPPTRAVLEEGYQAEFAQELVATSPAFFGYWVFAATIPALVVLFSVICFHALREGKLRSLLPAEYGAFAWLFAYAAMVLSLDHDGFEAWLPAITPFLLILGSRLAAPLSGSRHFRLLLFIWAVSVVHNSLAGVGVFATASRDYNVERGDPVTMRALEDDLILIGADWPLERYINYKGEGRTILVSRSLPLQDSIDAIEDAVASGHQVFIYHDLLNPSDWAMEIQPELSAFRHLVPAELLSGAKKIDLTDGASFHLLSKQPG